MFASKRSWATCEHVPLMCGVTPVVQHMNTCCFHFGFSIFFFRGLLLDGWRTSSCNMTEYKGNTFTAIWSSPEASTASKQLAVVLLLHVTTLILDPNASEHCCAAMIESKAWVTDNFQPGSRAEEKRRTTMCIYTNKAGCITVWSSFLSCDKPSKDTEEERQRIDGGGRETRGNTRRERNQHIRQKRGRDEWDN